MAGDKYLYNNNGAITEKAGIQSSAGASDAGKIIAADASGRLDSSLMPVGIGADTASVQASENLAAGDLVNIYDAGAGVFNVRKADASSTGKEAHGFVLAAVVSGSNATVYFEGTNTQVTSVAPGVLFLSATVPGGFASTAPTGSGQIVQRIGFGVSTTALNFQSEIPIVLA